MFQIYDAFNNERRQANPNAIVPPNRNLTLAFQDTIWRIYLHTYDDYEDNAYEFFHRVRTQIPELYFEVNYQPYPDASPDTIPHLDLLF
jgi:hypothetical protein